MILLDEVREAILAGRTSECAWDLFRVANFPGRDHEDAAAETVKWAHNNGLVVEFVERKVKDLWVVCILFTVRGGG